MIIIAKRTLTGEKGGNGRLVFICDDGKQYTPAELGNLTGVTGPTIMSRVIKYGISNPLVLSGPAKKGCRVDGNKRKSKKGRVGNCYNRGSAEFQALKGSYSSTDHIPGPSPLEQQYL